MEKDQVRRGQIVRVIAGPMTGFLGEVRRVGDEIVRVDVQVYGRATPVELAFGQIEAAPEKAH